MTIATISILEGRSAEQKRRLLVRVAHAIADSLGTPIDSVRVLVAEYPPSMWSCGDRSIAEISRAEAVGVAAASVADAQAKLLSN